MRFCKGCGQDRPLSEFHQAVPKNGMDYYCKPCSRHYKNMHRLAKLIYYDDLFELQKGVCAICGQPETARSAGKVKDLAIDIDPKTGKVRRLLCHRHNLAVGFVGDDPTIALAIVAYLLEFSDGTERTAA